MNFEIDYARAKDMASKLQEFLDANPKQKLSRSSSIEAVARMLGFNNRNEMAARIENQPEELLCDRSFVADQVQGIAGEIFKLIHPQMSGLSFWHATRLAVDEETGENALQIADSKITILLNNNKALREKMLECLAHDDEFLGTEGERKSLVDRIAMALVNKAMPEAERMWVTKKK